MTAMGRPALYDPALCEQARNYCLLGATRPQTWSDTARHAPDDPTASQLDIARLEAASESMRHHGGA